VEQSFGNALAAARGTGEGAGQSFCRFGAGGDGVRPDPAVDAQFAAVGARAVAFAGDGQLVGACAAAAQEGPRFPAIGAAGEPSAPPNRRG